MDFVNTINIENIENEVNIKFNHPRFLEIIINYFRNNKETGISFDKFLSEAKYLLSLIKILTGNNEDKNLKNASEDFFSLLSKFIMLIGDINDNLDIDERKKFEIEFDIANDKFYKNFILLLKDLSAIKEYLNRKI